ncbi:DUF938 domain-containing protein [Vreelandella subglaciescola]|jgi:cyclopropane fatty-acyl-phospholipid synthase-like methyltransferase|uniref:SAM-dependent methyltransferase n=1 Tax=Vreelandella subglaciescola TaxID=29571 RepID=A0A1M7EP55_9GAMM|nr:DUF938 domain-containing protein [Halomonas subglaciescola]SHL93478.1 Protein of unknown function [Halomonas subglaciescola]
MSASDDQRLQSPAAARNRDPILAVLREHLPPQARVLELASGSGEHGMHFAQAMPGWQWQPSDTNPAALASTRAWQESTLIENLLAPAELNVITRWPAEWQAAAFDAIVAINLIHISPWQVTQTLMRQANEYLSDNGVLFLYGPYRRGGQHTAPSNQAFDTDLKARDSSWGLRDLERVEAEAAANGLLLERVIEMPANNLSVIFRRGAR